MQESIVNKSPRRSIGRRVAAAGMALAAVLTLGACKATGGGQIDDPCERRPADQCVDGTFTGEANFGFNFTCGDGQEQGVIKGQITYHDTGTSVWHLRRAVQPGSGFTATWKRLVDDA